MPTGNRRDSTARRSWTSEVTDCWDVGVEGKASKRKVSFIGLVAFAASVILVTYVAYRLSETVENEWLRGLVTSLPIGFAMAAGPFMVRRGGASR
ncbi:hypothetical protein K7640_28995 [Micromonospora sp. PLK6-60]|uniref:hypothetical protein n=1 Tax=Micromonospora sp. PLK6-60 TaxID=2873383 RepID=UPI001CA760CC|nr:hypothetical protein [Micromonospora sp. PLK6-60]MBY8875872.1 hypothetical protein [Micromonospora sp. PLK6-60]